MRVAELGKPLRLILRELSRNRRRTLLTFVGLVLSFFLYTALESVLYTLNSVLRTTASDAVLFLRSRDQAGFFQPSLPESYAGQVRDIPGVVAASPLRFHVGQGRAEGSFAASLGVEIDSYLQLRSFRGLEPAELAAFRATRSGALVGARMLERHGWRVGDEVTIRGRSPLPSLGFTVVGDIDRADRFGGVALVHLDYLTEVLGDPGRVTFIQARVEHPSRASAIARAIDDRFRNFTVPTETITEKAHVATLLGSLSEALAAFRAIGYLALGVTVLVVGNSVAMSVRERTVELGTLRALGFGRGRVMGLVLGEAMLVAALGGCAGAGIAYVLFAYDVISLPPVMGRLRFVTDWTVVARAALLSLPVGALAALQPAWSAVRVSITDALRYAD